LRTTRVETVVAVGRILLDLLPDAESLAGALSEAVVQVTGLVLG
jgi:hypothetical protein